MDIIYDHLLSVTDYNNLRNSAGWKLLSTKQAEAGLANSAYVVAAKKEGNTIGMARVITDGGAVFYIQDVAVLPEYQGNGIGKTMLQMIMTFLYSKLEKGDIIQVGLMAAKGKEVFYKSFGFIERPNDQLGAGMTQWIGEDYK